MDDLRIARQALLATLRTRRQTLAAEAFTAQWLRFYRAINDAARLIIEAVGPLVATYQRWQVRDRDIGSGLRHAARCHRQGWRR